MPKGKGHKQGAVADEHMHKNHIPHKNSGHEKMHSYKAKAVEPKKGALGHGLTMSSSKKAKAKK